MIAYDAEELPIEPDVVYVGNVCLNNFGDAAGTTQSNSQSNNRSTGVIWYRDGAVLSVDPPPNFTHTSIHAINDFQIAVGFGSKAFDDNSMPSLAPFMVKNKTVIDLIPLVGPNAACTGINNAGFVCGYVSDDFGELHQRFRD